MGQIGTRLGAQTWGAKERTTLVSLKFGFFMFLCCVYNDQISVSRCVTMCVSDPGTLQQLHSGYRQGESDAGTWRNQFANLTDLTDLTDQHRSTERQGKTS